MKPSMNGSKLLGFEMIYLAYLLQLYPLYLEYLMQLKKRYFFTFILSLLALQQNAHADIKYSVVDLGSGFLPSDMNNNGQIVGYTFNTSTGAIAASIWENGLLTKLGGFGNDFSLATSINDNGQIVGVYGSSAYKPGFFPEHAFIYQNGVTENLKIPYDLFIGIRKINNNGQILASSLGGRIQTSFTFTWKNNSVIDILPLEGNVYSPLDINNFGQVVGDIQGHPYLWQNGITTYLGLDGTLSGYVSGINNNGQVIGSIVTSSSYMNRQEQAFIWENGVFTDIGKLSMDGYGPTQIFAKDINDKGQVVGTSGHAFLWQSGIMKDLNTLVSMAPNWELSDATRINDKGQIIVSGFNEPLQINSTFLLTPISVPVPGAVWLFCSALLGFSGINYWMNRDKKSSRVGNAFLPTK
jgi:probable HAF family extracellular repeat protein